MTGDASEPNAVVLRPSALPAHERGGGTRTTALVSPAIGARGFINGITSFEPGAAVAFHSHNCEESVTLIEGEALLEMQGRQVRLQPLDTTWIPPNVSHRFRNPSDTRPMKILWTYARVDATRTLTETGRTGFVADEHAG